LNKPAHTGNFSQRVNTRARCGENGDYMKTSDLLFIGIKGSVVALDRTTGEQAWATSLKGSDFVNVVVQDEAVLASCRGEIFCLDPLTGVSRWHNPLKGFGWGLATIATGDCSQGGNAAALAERRLRDEQGAAGGAVAATTAASCS
jgi:outer membrane protein assembly factor BamB